MEEDKQQEEQEMENEVAEEAQQEAEEEPQAEAEEKTEEEPESEKEEDAGEAEEEKEEPKEEKKSKEDMPGPKIYAVRTTANREDQVLDFLSANAEKKKLEVYSVVRPHGMRSYLFVEAANRMEAEQAAFDAPYARGVLPEPVPYEEIEHMVETIKREVNIQKNDIVEIISGPFKREQAKVTKVDKEKEEVVVELLEAAVPIPITLKIDALKVIRREES
ncbi:transcription elongation factor Spt5 [Candidatus Woesearchaeota archaeon]|nr:transcription elongation factor Spt5 [Candidatus Woesearchaeota archaeon]